MYFLCIINSNANMNTDIDTYSFTKRLKEETKENHKILDTHYFVKSIFSSGAVNEENLVIQQ